MNIKNSVRISLKYVFKWTWRERFYSSTMFDESMVEQDLSSFKKFKYPESMFIHNNNVAKNISDTVCSHLMKRYGSKQLKIIEVNPGLCLITQHMLKNTNYVVYAYENNYNEFKEYLSTIQSIYGNRIHVTQGNLLLLWKFGFQDRMDKSDRVSKFLSNLGPPQPWNLESPSFTIIATLPNKKFLNYLIYSFIFQTGLMAYGRPEFYFLLSPSVFKRYSSKPIEDPKFYKTQSILFQTIFSIELLKSYPRTAFFPPHYSKSASKNVRFKELKEADDKFILLVKVEGRQEILESGLTEDLLKPFWYFVKHHTLSRKNFVIPMLEQWIPGCGPHFIAQGYTIFTQFGDLTPSQILRVFLKFISLPEYKDSPFLSTMENRIGKLLPSAQTVPNDSAVVESSEENVLNLEELKTND